MTTTEMTTEQQCHAMMNRNGFHYNKKRFSIIWAAKHRHCPECKQPPGQACINLSDLKTKAREHCKFNRFPHTGRVDWEKLLSTLQEKGYK